jgi:uncharacterized protein (TIGR02145 family)
MKERGSFIGFPGVKIFLGACALVFIYSSSFCNINYCISICNVSLVPADTTLSTVPCPTLFDDSVTKFIRFDHSDSEYDYYSLKLSMFSDKNQRLIFYEEARGIEFFMTDKLDIFKDSALFSTHVKDRVHIISTVADFYHFVKDQKHPENKNEKTPIEETQGIYRPAAPGSGGHGSPMTVSLTCDGAQVACSENVYSFPAGTSGQAPPAVNGYPNYGCLGSQPCPAWFYMQVGIAGDIIISISQAGPSGPHDVDFICWGPFATLTDGCTTGLTGTCQHSGIPPPPLCCTNTQFNCQNFYPRGNMVDCSFDGAATETCHILNAQVGDIYILLITNYSTLPGTITFSQTGGTGWTNCNIVYHCSMISITANPSLCSGLTNTYSVSGNIEFTNPPPAGTLSITDITAVPQVSQTLFPPFISPMAYNLLNIPCDGLVHTLVAVFSDSLACTLNHLYTAPPESCPQAVISGGGHICSDGSTTTNIIINFTGTGPYNFTYAINGVLQTPVTGYNGPFPYTLATNIPGTYTLVSVSNAGCTGTGIVSGTAIVIGDPLPVPVITGNSTACAGSAGNVYTTQTGMHNYLWTVSPGGSITAGGGLNDYTCTVTWNSSGGRTISVNYTDGNGCNAATPTMYNVTVNPSPVITNAGSSTVCSGTILNIIPAANIPGSSFTWTASGSSLNVSGYFPGSGTSISDQLINSGFNSELVTYSVTPTANSCQGIPADFPVTVVPVADVYFNPASQALCSGLQSNVQILSHVTGTTFTWTCNGSSGNVSGFSEGSGNQIQQTLTNTGNGIETVTYHVIPVVSGCTGTPSDMVVTVDPLPQVSLASCWDPKTTNNAKPFRLKGGNPPGGTYSGSGISSGIFTPSLAGTGTHTIHYSYTNTFGCNRMANQTIIVLLPAGFICGNTFTDIRDNKTYATIQIGTQCWMAANLNYGTLIPANTSQRDNCTWEKYCYNDVTTNCGQQTYYQWDELMQYDEIVSKQGLCPSAWHIPTEAEWNTLFANFTGSGFAATPLKNSGFSGFDAVLSGARYFISGFATYFWSSTLHGTDKAWAHGMNDPDPSVSFYPSFRTNAFSVRCIRD